MSQKRTTKQVWVGFRQYWWQFWLPDYVAVEYDAEPYIYTKELVNALNDMCEEMYSRLENVQKLEGRLSAALSAVESKHIEVKDQTDEATPQPVDSRIMDVVIPEDPDVLAAEAEGVTGGDFNPGTVGGAAVEYDPDNKPVWTPNQTSSVVVAAPPIINKLRQQAKHDSKQMRRM